MSDTLTAPAVAPAKPLSRIQRLRNRVSGFFAMLAALIVVPVSAASATEPVSTDPTGGAGDTFFTALTAYLQDHLIVAVLALAVIGVAVSMLIAWGKKAAKSK